MDYLIQAYENETELIGSINQALVYEAKTFRKVQNRLNYFNPDKRATTIKVFSYTDLYNEATFKLVKTISA